MKITSIELRSVRGFKVLPKVELSTTINIFIGANNSGKSTILNSIFLLQNPKALSVNDITIGNTRGIVTLEYEGDHLGYKLRNGLMSWRLGENISPQFIRSSDHSVINSFHTTEPMNLIYPYLSKRKTVKFQDNINAQSTNSVLGNFSNLYSKIDRLITPQFQPGNKKYLDACKSVLGFDISTIASQNGKKAVYFIHNMEHIPLTAMGEGVTNIIGLITDLCVAENRIFLIEELENDIHPQALKALLKLIVDSSSSNQFFISTHSNIVMKYLGGIADTKIFNITNECSDKERPKLFISSLEEIPPDPERRREILEDLGYEFHDFGLWAGWLFLEESSAEVLIREWFIKWYTPTMVNKLRTYSANSTSQVILKFDDFNRLFVYLHLEPKYKNKVWVIIDDGDDEKEIIDKLKLSYTRSGWNEENFSQFTEHDFESYYPEVFQEKVAIVLAMTNKKAKRKAKKELLDEVKAWIVDNEKLAKKEFKLSAKSVIDKLKEIEKKI